MRSPGAELAALRRRNVPHTCPVCGMGFTGMAKARFCSNRCKQRNKREKSKLESAPSLAALKPE